MIHHPVKNLAILVIFLTVVLLHLQASGWEGVPAILRISDAVSPGQSFSINGSGFNNDSALTVSIEISTDGFFHLLPSARSIQPNIIQKDRDGNFIVAVMPAGAAAGVYTLWVKNKNGWSLPKKLNAARPLFISEREVFSGLSIRVSGRNLDFREFGLPGQMKTRARLIDGKDIYNAPVTDVNPYCVTFKVTGEPPGNYLVELSNDNGINWVTLDNGQRLSVLPHPGGSTEDYDPLGLGVAWSAHFNWKNIRRVPVSNGSKDVTAAVQAIVDRVAAEPGGGIIYFPNGTYNISKLELSRNIVLKGESRAGTLISYCGSDKDFITCRGAAITGGHVGVANMSIIVPHDIKERPDVFINLGQASIWQGVGNIHQRTASEMFLYNLKIECDFTETVKSHRGLPISSIGSERLYIANCDFKGFRMESHNYVSEYVTVKNNMFEFAQGVFIYTGNYLFLENNCITGHTEINREKHGFMLRANAYVYNNSVAHTGSDQDTLNENWNDGEALCNETPGGSHNFGDVSKATANTITAGETAGPFSVPETEIYSHRSVMIINGRGLGQYRRVADIDTVLRTFVVEKNWDVIPDSTSRFTLMEPNENITYYRNTVEDNPKGIWLFGNSVDCVAAENTSINSDGIFIFSCMYTNNANHLYYFVPNYFNRITGNIINGTSRKSHRAGIGVNSTREGISNGAYFGVQHYGNEFRNNYINGSAAEQPLAEVTEAPAASGIFIYATIHSSLYDNKNIAGDVTNSIIENNALKNLAAGISLSRCIYGQVIRNNSIDSSVKIPYNDATGSQCTGYFNEK